MKINTKEVLTRAVDQVLPGRSGLEKLMKKRKIRVYLGIDPTAKKLHLGHVINLKKLQEFADLGHEAILVIGTGTVLAGDPSLRESARKRISKKEVKENIRTWKRQAGKILNLSKIKIKYNGDWLLKLGYKDIIEIASHISALKLFRRESFQRRIKKGDTVWTHETLYPLAQGYDSVYLDVDLEIGGTDQVFNMLVGRELQRKMNNKEKFVLTSPMILGIDGKQMSKTSGNCIWIEDSAEEMYGKTMSIPDTLIFDYLELAAAVSLAEIKKLKKSQKDPRKLKSYLAKKIVSIYYGEKEAKRAEKEFDRIFKKRELPSKIPEIKIKEKKLDILDLLVRTRLTSSKAEARRLILQGGVKIDKKIQTDWQAAIKIKKDLIVQVGKRKFAKLA